MKNFLKWLQIWAGFFVFLIVGSLSIYFAIKAWSSTNPNLTEPAPNGGLYVNNNETLSAAKRNVMADKVNKDYPQETLAAWVAGTEQDTGIKRIDGKEIYRKVFNLWTMVNATSVKTLYVAHGVWLSNIISIKWVATSIPRKIVLWWWIWSAEGTELLCNATLCGVQYFWNRSWRSASIVVEYTKS